MTGEFLARLSKNDRNHVYRCSGCGKLVDDRNSEEVELHRKHGFSPQSVGLPRQQQSSAVPPVTG